MNLNKAFILGRLTRDPETRALPSGQSVASFSMATNRVWNDQGGNKQESVEYHNIVAFGKLADICSRYLNKGRLVLVEGRIQTRSWQDQAGVKKYRTEIVADTMQMGPRMEGGNVSGGNSMPAGNRAAFPAGNNMNNTPRPDDNIPVIDAENPIMGEEPKEEINIKDIPF